MISVDMNMSKQKVDIKLTSMDNQDELLHINFNTNQDQKKTQKKLREKKSINQGKAEDNVEDATPIKRIDDDREDQERKQLENSTQVIENSQQQEQQQQQTHQSSQHPASIKQQRLPLSQTLKKSKLLGQIFKHFCNMTYANSNKKTFQQMSRTNIYMSLNRFMLFCKQFNIDRIVRVDVLKSKKQANVKGGSQRSKANKTEEIESRSSQDKIQIELKQKQKISSPPKRNMLQIPVHNINNTEKTLTKLYQKHTNKHDNMTYQQFTTILLEIYNIYQKNINQFHNNDHEQKLQVNNNNKDEIEERFLSDVLVIDDVKRFESKMTNLKILFKGAISYHQEQTVKKSPSFLSKKLVIHGGRSPQEMRKELDIYQSQKIDKKQSWIGKQSQTIGVYSKSRVFYRPNPSTTYQTNEVLRLARKQAGRSQTQNLLIPQSKTQKRQQINRKQSGANFSKLFEDKSSNRFSKKLLKINHHHDEEGKSGNNGQYKRERSKERKTEISDDDILAKYFENERKAYGNQ